MKIKLNGIIKEFSEPLSIFDIILDINVELSKTACIAKINNEYLDLRTVIKEDAEIEVLRFEDDIMAKKAFWHTTSHVLAMAVKKLYPSAKVAIGPAIDDGYYYDFDINPLTREDLDKIEKEMKKIIKRAFRVNKSVVSRSEAIDLFSNIDEVYKVELINEIPEDEVISVYSIDDFSDLCAGPHLMNIKPIKAFKLLSSSGAYWKGDENNKMLTRIYGTSYPDKEGLDAHMERLEDIKRRDHNKLGREMEIFTTVDIIGQGLPLLMPKGTKIIQTMQRWIEDEEESRGYLRTKTPLMAKSDLYKLSGHWQHYKDNMMILGDPNDDDKAMALRPMTCPFQYMIYKAKQRSYRDLPMRLGETSTLFRNEDSGEMHGLIRLRQFTISEGHIIITPEQVESEIKEVLELIDYCMRTLGIKEDVWYRLSKWDPNNTEKYIGTAEEWNRTQDILRDILVNMGHKFEEADGEAAIYGPKIDIQFKNVYGKEDTIITVQLDCSLAEVYDMYYIDENGEKKRPYIIHRTSCGCYERMLAMLIEKYAGQLPTWLCPEQVRVLPLSEKYEEYANKVVNELKKNGILATADHRAEKIGYKIREARLERIPYQIIVGQNEQDTDTVSVRSRYLGDEGSKKLDKFIDDLSKEIRTKEIRIIEVDESQNK